MESDRCYFCYDAPCIEACPTGIDIPSFIHKIATGNVKGAAHDILKQNIMGAVCARVCPTEVLCEGACVRNGQEHKPVAIGALQRYATDCAVPLRHAALPGAGRAAASASRWWAAARPGCPVRTGLRCSVTRSRCSKRGPSWAGLNEYGVAAYKVTEQIAQREVDYLLQRRQHRGKLGQRARPRHLAGSTAARTTTRCSWASGWARSTASAWTSADLSGVHDAIKYIETLRQAEDLG